MSFFDRRSGKLFAGEAAGAYTAKVDLLRPATPPPLLLEHYLESMDKLLRRDVTGIYYAHYGPGEDARAKLQRHKEQAKLWRDVISETLEHGAEYEDIFSKLLAEDASLNGLKKLPEDQYQREHYFIINAITGFVGYIEKQKI
jgi:glyoxylase-like metal-dependent hydrolase (beta-lactamase superfamily II)